MKNLIARLGSLWKSMPASRKDALILFAVMASIWSIVEYNKWCHEFFEFLTEYDYGLDSLFIAFVLASLGMAIYAWRRFLELDVAMAARAEAEKRAFLLAYRDSLTSLPNRRALHQHLDLRTSNIAKDETFGFILIDLDRFKAVNDLHGHSVGDELLVDVSARFRSLIGPDDFFCRLGGDEFAIIVALLPGEERRLTNLSQQIVDAAARPFVGERFVHHVGATVGSALFPMHADTPEALIRCADIALYRAKEEGRSTHRHYEASMDERVKARGRLEQDLREGLAAGQFKPFYQPVVDLRTGSLCGFEALARWIRPDGQNIGPDTFISIAEECGLIDDLFLALLNQVCMDARDWPSSLSIAVNVSPVQLRDPWLAQKVMAVLTRNGFAPKRLAIEITENAIIGDEENAKSMISSFKNQGMAISLDDFGTGYSSLQHLRLLPFDKIKIDRSFIQAMGSSDEAFKIVKAIASLADSLNQTIVAEGIESVEIAEQLAGIGCAQGQGYYFGRPQSAAITTLLVSQDSVRPAMEETAVPVPLRQTG